jgi:SAM-dependent methyltransferase
MDGERMPGASTKAHVGPALGRQDSTGERFGGMLGITAARRYRQWEYELVAPHLGRSVLEIGSGMGHFSERLIESRRDRLILSDTDVDSLQRLRAKFAGFPGVEFVEVTLPGRPGLDEPVESVVAMNVLEHIEDDAQALRDLAAVVSPGGCVILWVPAYMQLYGDFDRMAGHWRRYTPETMRETVEGAGLGVRLIRRVNMLGAIAWWMAVRAGRARHADTRLVWLYDNLLIPSSRLIERVVPPPFGQSLLCVAEVTATPASFRSAGRRPRTS